jgi:uncharacterized phage infection (PIP) family protein YhgE
MSNEILGKAVDHMGELQKVSLKSLDMINKNADNLNKLAEFLKEMQDNQNLLATKVLELEQRLNIANKGIERIDERPKN